MDYPPLRVRRKLVDSLQLIVNMSLLIEAYAREGNVSDELKRRKAEAAFAQSSGVASRRLSQFIDETWSDISRVELQTFMILDQLLPKDRTLKYPFLSLVPHPFWETYDTVTNGYPAVDSKGGNVPVDAEVLAALTNAGIPIRPGRRTSLDNIMRKENCIFVGSPKHNPRTDEALRLFFPDPNKRPVLFTRDDWGNATTPFRAPGPKGLSYRIGENEWADAFDRSSETHGKREKPLPPCGVLLVCRRPLGTKENVTTMIIAGCSVLGTRQIAQELLDGSIFARPDSLVSGEPRLFFLIPKGENGTIWHQVDWQP